VLPERIKATLLDELYLFNETDYDGDTQDEDLWAPMAEESRSITIGNKTITSPLKKEAVRNRIKEATQYIISLGIKPVDLYNEAMKITGNTEEIILATGGKMNYDPRGTITVTDIDAGANEGVKGATIKARRWFKLRTATTDNLGRFNMPNGNFRKKAMVLVKFKNAAAKVRGINGLLKEWQYVFPAKRNIGLYTQADMENITFNFDYNANASTMGAMHWVAAQTMNAVWEMNERCQTAGIPNPPSNLNVWVSSAVTSDASTPMLRYITNTSLVSQGIDAFLVSSPTNWGILAIKRIIQAYLPDITLRYGKNDGTQPKSSVEIYNSLFHELAHSVHYGQVGNNYWTNVIAYEVGHGGYGARTSDDAQRIAVTEGWGFYVGNTFNSDRYFGMGSALIGQQERQQLENQTPDNSVATAFGFDAVTGDGISRGWIPFGMYHDMTDNGETIGAVNDNVNAYTMSQVFSGLQPHVVNVQGLRVEVLSRNNNLQSAELNQLVTSYGY
jgi:hypothetical protein